MSRLKAFKDTMALVNRLVSSQYKLNITANMLEGVYWKGVLRAREKH